MKNKWIECNCFLISKNLEDMGVNQEGDMDRMCFDVDSISSFREAVDEKTEDISDNTCMVMFKSGDSCLVDLSCDAVRALVN
jgi:hypothetical protein